MKINRREWIQKSLLASSAMLVAGTSGALGCAENGKQFQAANLKLNWNENPYGPPENSVKAVQEAIKFANLYPDEQVAKLKTKLAELNAVKEESILLTAGSTEILSLLGQHVALQGGSILTPYPTFPTALQFGMACGADVEKVDLDDEDAIHLDRLRSAIKGDTKLVFVCNPNNPTGTELNTSDLKSFLKSIPSNVLVCVDEAYIEYSKPGLPGSMISLVGELPNLIICRTFSKAYGLAGLRIGYAISNPENIRALRNRHLGFEMSTGWPPLVAAEAALDDETFLKNCLANNEASRRVLYRAFEEWDVSFNPSSTNFVRLRDNRFQKNVVQKLEKRGVLITKWPDMHDHIRVSLGKPNEMEEFVGILKDYLV